MRSRLHVQALAHIIKAGDGTGCQTATADGNSQNPSLSSAIQSVTRNDLTMQSGNAMGGKCCMRAQLVEIVMDLGRPPLARFPSGDLRLADDVISNADLAHAISKVPCRPAARMQMAPPYFTPAHKLEKYHLLC